MSSVKFPSLERRGSHSARVHHSRSSSQHAAAAAAAFHPSSLSNPVAAVAASAHSSRSASPVSRSGSPTSSARRGPRDDDGGGSGGGGGGGAAGAPPSLSHLVAASLSAAASHERAIMKWARDIQREVDDYKAGILAAKTGGPKSAAGAATANHGRSTQKRTPASLPAQLGRLTALDPAFSHSTAPARASSPPRRPRAVSTSRDLFGSTSSNNFMRDDIQSVHPRSTGRFYPTNLVKVHGNGSLSAREPASSRSQQQSQGNAALYHHRSTVMARKKAAAQAANEAAQAGAHSVSGADDKGQMIAAIFGAAAAPSSAAHTAPPSARAALHSLPPSLSPADMRASGLGATTAGGASDLLDESAAFKSPALYMDLRMRQLFHQNSGGAAPGVAPQSSSQKAHVIVHLIDVLGELVEPDSQQAYQALSDTLKELILAAEYKNLIPVNQTSTGRGAGVGGGGGGPNAATASTPSSSDLPAAQHKELLRRDKLKWDAAGNLRPEAGGGPWGAKTLAQSLADGSLDKNAPSSNTAAGAGKPDRSPRGDRAREKEHTASSAAERARAERGFPAHPASSADEYGDASDESGTAYADARRAFPSIAFDGDYSDSGGGVVGGIGDLSHSSVAPVSVVPFAATPVVARTSPASLAHLRQVPAAYLEVAWTLKAEVERLCTRLADLQTASSALEAEQSRLSVEHSYLNQWNQKKSLQLHLHSRSEINLANEILLLKHLLVDIKEELEGVNQENIMLEEDYLANGLVFGGSFALEEFRYEEETRNYPNELRVARRQMEQTLSRIERAKRDLHDIHTERDLLLTRIEVLTQAVSMMHNDEEQEEQEQEEEESNAAAEDEQRGEEQDESSQADRRARSAKKRTKSSASSSVPSSVDPHGYPYVQQRWDDLRGRGRSNQSVPRFLRFDGWFPDLRLSKQEVEVRVKEVWSLKTIADEKAKQVGGKQTTLHSYFEEYLRKRFHAKVDHASTAATTTGPPEAEMAASQLGPPGADAHASTSFQPSPPYALEEFVLNFFSTLERHFVDQDFILFLKVVSGSMHEAHYRDQMQLLANFKEAVFRWDLSEHDAARGQRVDGLIGRDTFLRGLRMFFPHKSDAHMAELAAILERDCMATPTPTSGAQQLQLHEEEQAPMVDVRKILSAGADGVDGGDADVDAGHGGDDSTSALSSVEADVSAMGGSYTSNFLECIRAQYLSEIDTFVSRIHSDLLALHELRSMERARAVAARDGTPFRPPSLPADPRFASLSAYDIRCVLRAADLHRSTNDLTDLLRRGCNEPYLSRDTQVTIQSFMHNIVQSGLVHTTDHWRRVPPLGSSFDIDQPSSDRATSLATEERRAAAGADGEQHDAASAVASPSMPVHRLVPTFQRRASMEDEAMYLAARSAAGLPLEYA